MKQFKLITYTNLVIIFIRVAGATYESLKEEISNLGADLKEKNSVSETKEPHGSEEVDKYVYTLDQSLDKKPSNKLSNEEIYELGDTKDNNINQRSLIYIQRSKKIPVRLDIIKTGDALHRNNFNDVWTYTKLLNTFFKQQLSPTPYFSNRGEYGQTPVTVVNEKVQYVTEKPLAQHTQPQPTDTKIEVEKNNMHMIIDKYNSALKEFNNLHERPNGVTKNEWTGTGTGNYDARWRTNDNFPNSYVHSGDMNNDDNIRASSFMGSTLDTPDIHKHTPSKWIPERKKFVSKITDASRASATIPSFKINDSIVKAGIVNPLSQYAVHANATTAPRIRLKQQPWTVFSDEYKMRKNDENNIATTTQIKIEKDPFYSMQKPMSFQSSSTYQYTPSVESGKHRNFYAIDNLNGGYASEYSFSRPNSKDHYKTAQYIFNKRDDVVKNTAPSQKDADVSLSMWSDYIDSIIGTTEGDEH